MEWPCAIVQCTEMGYDRLSLVQHIRTNHARCDHFRCRIGSCNVVSSTFESYRVHLWQIHNEADATGIRETSIPVPLNLAANDMNSLDSSTSSGSDGIVSGIQSLVDDELSEDGSVNFESTALEFFLKYRESNTFSKAASRGIMRDMLKLLEKYGEMIIHQVTGTSSENLKDDEANSGRSAVLPCLKNIYAITQSENLFRKEMRKMGMVEPVQISAPAGPETCEGQMESYQYIPILLTLSRYLSHRDVIESVERNLCRPHDEVLNSFADGYYFKTNAYFKGDRNLLRIQMYCDEIEVTCNVIGNGKVVHKLRCFYFALGNVETRFLSHLRNIHPVVIVKSSVVENIGYAKVMEPLCRDLRILETTGISVPMHDGSTRRFRGGLATVSGDNSGLHGFGGFQKNFNHGRICRFCMCWHSDLRKFYSECRFQLRTPERHDWHVSLVESDLSFATAYGVTTGNPLRGLESFHVITGLPPDILHTVVEGNIRGLLKFVIANFYPQPHDRKRFIKRINDFSYGKTDSKNCPYIREKLSSLSGSQTWCLFRILPFVMTVHGTSFDSSNRVWELYLLLSEVCDFVMAKSLTKDMVPCLDVCATGYFEAALACAPQIIKPESHYLLHCARMISNFGPLPHLWTYGFESYHRRVKKIVKEPASNFTDVAFTVASRLQYRKLWEMLSYDCLVDEAEEEVMPVPLSYDSIPTQYRELIETENTILTVNILQIENETFERGNIYVIDELLGQPVFLELEYILFFEENWNLCGKVLSSTFSKDLHSYAVERTSYHHILPIKKLKYPHSYDIYTLQSGNYIRLDSKVFFEYPTA